MLVLEDFGLCYSRKNRRHSVFNLVYLPLLKDLDYRIVFASFELSPSCCGSSWLDQLAQFIKVIVESSMPASCFTK